MRLRIKLKNHESYKFSEIQRKITYILKKAISTQMGLNENTKITKGKCYFKYHFFSVLLFSSNNYFLDAFIFENF